MAFAKELDPSAQQQLFKAYKFSRKFLLANKTTKAQFNEAVESQFMSTYLTLGYHADGKTFERDTLTGLIGANNVANGTIRFNALGEITGYDVKAYASSDPSLEFVPALQYVVGVQGRKGLRKHVRTALKKSDEAKNIAGLSLEYEDAQPLCNWLDSLPGVAPGSQSTFVNVGDSLVYAKA